MSFSNQTWWVPKRLVLGQLGLYKVMVLIGGQEQWVVVRWGEGWEGW
jgi:hypothetical protein